MSNNLKLGVEVVSAHDLLPGDGDGTVTTFVELSFDGQRHRTAVRDHDLNPYFNERFFFTVSAPSSLPSLASTPPSSTSTAPPSPDPSSAASASPPLPSPCPLRFPRPLLPSREARWRQRRRGLLPHSRRAGAQSVPHRRPVGSALGQNLRQDQFADIPPEPDMSTFFSLFRSQQRQQQRSDQAPPSRVMRMFSSVSSRQPAEFQIKETSPALGGGRIVRGRVVVPGDKPGAFDLVEKMEFLFVRVVKARDLPAKDVTGSLDPTSK
uniref:C2 domain-containing protein n=1 Tax=Ananas comosus var. bracteatus TaxID=296719 RepID=A0A6V7NJH6_ANACO|nr:unnamed protein product [Ananas comosus var. bracteatus]